MAIYQSRTNINSVVDMKWGSGLRGWGDIYMEGCRDVTIHKPK